MSERPAFPRLLQTPRLALAPVGADDGDALLGLWRLPEVRRALWRGHAISAEQAREMAGRSAWLHEHHGTGLWTARRHGEDALAGFGGYWFVHDDEPPELLYAIDPPSWGQGLAGEMVHALVTYGWSVLHLPEIRASAESTNAASLKLLRRLGFTRDARVGGDVQVFCMRPSRVDDSWGT